MIFCGEWLENWNGTIEKIRLKKDLSAPVGKSKVLFRAFDSPWSREKDIKGNDIPNKVTDGPWLFRTQTGKLGMLWTSWVFWANTPRPRDKEKAQMNAYLCHEAVGLPKNRDKFHPR